MEAGSPKKADINEIRAFGMCRFRNFLNVCWVKVINVEVSRRMGKEPGVANNKISRKLQYFGHMLRGEKYQLSRLIKQGQICRRKAEKDLELTGCKI